MRRRMLATFLAAGFAATLAGSLFAQPEFDFMPDGGRETLLRLAGAASVDLRAVIVRKATEAEWRADIAVADPSLTEDAIETLASYLAINMPTDGEPPGTAQTLDALAVLLSPDGKELAIANCQFCHGFFSGYLAHDRDAEGWRAVFKSPFHSELPMTERERETFSRYSAINMPIPYDKVPEDLRF